MMNENRSKSYLIGNLRELYELDYELSQEIKELTQRVNPTMPNEAQGETDQVRLKFLRKLQRRIQITLNITSKKIL